MKTFNSFMSLSFLLMNGCASYHLPNSHNAPLRRKKNDARFSFSGTQYVENPSRPSEVEFQVSYSGFYQDAYKTQVI